MSEQRTSSLLATGRREHYGNVQLSKKPMSVIAKWTTARHLRIVIHGPRWATLPRIRVVPAPSVAPKRSYFNVLEEPIMSFIERIRRLIDGEPEVPISPDAGKSLDIAGKSAEAFLVMIARHISTVMEQEMFTPPGGITYIPREYVLYLNPEDNTKWRGEKREGMQAWLSSTIGQRIESLSNSRLQEAIIQIRVDATLQHGSIWVQPLWDTMDAGRVQASPSLQT